MSMKVGPYTQQALANQAMKSLAQRVEYQQQLFENDEERREFELRIRPVIEYTRPDLIPILNHSNDNVIIDSKSDKMYTSRNTTALEKASDAFVGNVFGDANWFGVSIPGTETGDFDEIQAWCQKFKDSLYSLYDRSNFYETLAPVAMDALSIGDGMTFCGDDTEENLPYFTRCNILRTWWRRNRQGSLASVHELVVMKAMEAVEFFSRDGDKISDRLDALAIQKPLEDVTFIHSVYRNTDKILDGINLEKPREWIELWVQRNAEENNDTSDDTKLMGIVRQSGFDVMPYFDWPYYLIPGETYGRGPFVFGKHTLVAYNSFWKSVRIIAQRLAGPPIKASEDLKGKIDVSPDGVTWMKDTNSVIETIHKGADPRVLLELMEKMEGEIDDSLHLPLFLMLSMHEGDMTIPELVERLGEKATALMPRIGSMRRLYLDKSHERVISIERARGNLDFMMPPDIVAAVNSLLSKPSVNITYKGMLKESQTQMVLGRRMRTAFDLLNLALPIDPESVRFRMNTAKVTEKIMDDTDFPQDCINSDKDVKNAIEQANKQAAIERTAELAKVGSEADRNMAAAQAQGAVE